MNKESFGKILEINLENQSFEVRKYETDMANFLLGGPGFAIDYLLKNKIYTVEPNSSEIPLIFMTGLLTGTTYPC